MIYFWYNMETSYNNVRLKDDNISEIPRLYFIFVLYEYLEHQYFAMFNGRYYTILFHQENEFTRMCIIF